MGYNGGDGHWINVLDVLEEGVDRGTTDQRLLRAHVCLFVCLFVCFNERDERWAIGLVY